MKDNRYKVSQGDIYEMRRMRMTGMSYQKIADAFDVSYGTAYYWINDQYRKEKREKNALRRYEPGDERRIARDMQKRRENFKGNPNMKLRHSIQSAVGEKRVPRKTVRGMKMDDARKLLKSGELRQKNSKMED